jgi:hypothetical protein
MSYSADALPNILRLQGLKNVSGRRKVMPGSQILQNMESMEPEVQGTANVPEMVSNLPQEDLGGELQPQSYDVRANSSVSPQEDQGVFYKIGQALSEYINPEKRQEMAMNNQQLMSRSQQAVPQTPPIETAQVDMQEGLPPVTASEQESQPGIWDSIAKLGQSFAQEAQKPYAPLGETNALEKIGTYFKEGYTPRIDEAVYERNPNLQKPQSLIESQERAQQVDHEAIDRAQEDPWNIAAYGATDAFANSPELVEQFKQYTGMDFTEEERALTEKYEKVLSDLDKNINADNAGYDDQQMRIKERIENNQTTNADKFFIGLALLMPLLIGGMYGKEAGLGALGGAAKGLADVYANREKNIRADEELLASINKEQGALNLKKGEIDLERAKIPSEVKKLLPKDEYEDIKGMDVYRFTDPNTGEIVGEGVKVLPDLYMDMSYYNTSKKREGASAKAEKLGEEKAALERANAATKDVINAATQLKEPGLMGKILAYALAEDQDGALKKIVRQQAPEIVVDGRKQNAAVYIDSKVEQIKDAYRRNEQMRAFTNTVAAHIGNMAENPLYSGLKPEDLIDQMLILRDRGQNFFVDRAEAQGFLGAPLKSNFGKENRDLYKKLNRRAEMKELEADKLEAIQTNAVR